MGRGISELLGLLIVVAIVVGAAFVATRVVSENISGAAPKGGIVRVSHGVWWTDGYTLFVKGYIVNLGRDRVNVLSMKIWFENKTIELNMAPFGLRPGEGGEALGYINLTEFRPATSTLTIIYAYHYSRLLFTLQLRINVGVGPPA
jgi:flagellin-like protein